MASSETDAQSVGASVEDFRLSMCANCMELIPRGDMQQHAKTCVNEIWSCLECGLHLNVSAKSDHIAAHLTIRCDLCGDSLDQTTSKAHATICTMRPVLCQWCTKPFPFVEKPTHELACGSVEEQCASCDNFVMRSLIVPHLSSSCVLHKRTNDKLPMNQITGVEQPAEYESAGGDAKHSSHSTHPTSAMTSSTAASVDCRPPFGTPCTDGQSGQTHTAQSVVFTTSSEPATEQTQRCKICGELYSLRVLPEHTKLCEVICRSTITNRPFSRGSPLPAVGLPSAASASTATSGNNNATERRVSSAATPPLKPARSNSGRRRGASTLFAPLVVPPDAPTARQREGGGTTHAQGMSRPRHRKQQVSAKERKDASATAPRGTLGASLTVSSVQPS